MCPRNGFSLRDDLQLKDDNEIRKPIVFGFPEISASLVQFRSNIFRNWTESLMNNL